VRGAGAVVLGALAVSALSALLVAPAPSYDPWMWLLWGREVAHGTLSTAEGPAFKPLPVAVCALLAPLGSAAPAAWVILARAGALAALWLAARAGRRLAGGSRWAGVAAAVAVAACAGWSAYAAAGAETGWVVALALAGAEAWRAGRARAALACGAACALLRVEAWPFLLVAAVVLWRRRPQDRLLLAACAAAVPALWFVPDLLATGDLLRSGTRARVPNPGQPALADVPAWASLRAALGLPPWAIWPGVVAAIALPAARPARLALAAGAAWIALVAAMAQAGFSGEPRYALPGAALVAIAGAAGLVAAARAARPSWRAGAAVAAAVLLAGATVPRLAHLPELRRTQDYQRGLDGDLAAAVRAAGGRDAVLACGRPYAGPLRGPLLAYRLDVAKRRVGFEPRAPGVVFRSRLRRDDAAAPAVPAGFAARAAAGRWTVHAACRY
jgi:hypothetical protein